MSKRTLTLVCCLAIAGHLFAGVRAQTACNFDQQGGYTELVLSTPINYKAYHKVDGSTFHLILTADTDSRWLGFGIGEPTSGHMKGGDFVTVSWDDQTNQATAQDRYATFAAFDGSSYSGLTASLDSKHDWTIVEASKGSGKQVIHMTRALDTGDTQDRVIGTGPQKALWAYGDSLSVGYHASRGSVSTEFRADPNPPLPTTMPTSDGSWEVRFGDYTIPSSATTYSCQAFNLQNSMQNTARHIVAFRPKIQESTAAHVHHIVIHSCTDGQFTQHHATPRVCDDQTFGDRRQSCSSIIYAWAVGMGDLILPTEAGIRMGGANGVKHILVEIHYDNPQQLSNVVDRSGVEMFYVNTLRTHDAGVLWVGDPTVSMSQQHTTPYPVGNLPGSTGSVHRQATCPGDCTAHFTSDITVFASFLHMHNYGQTIVSDHYGSNGQKVRTLNRIDFWDNGFQQFTPIGPYTVSAGDSIQTHCVFNTAQQSTTVQFGSSTEQEMCMEFIMYYPAQQRGNAPLEMCGMRASSSAVDSLCGTSQATYATGQTWQYTGTGQSDRGTAPIADPLSFGTAPSTTQAATAQSMCSADLASSTFDFTATNNNNNVAPSSGTSLGGDGLRLRSNLAPASVCVLLLLWRQLWQ